MYTTRRRVALVMTHYYPNKNLFCKYSLNLPPLSIFLCRFNALLFAYLWILRFPSFLSFMKHSRTKILFSSSVYPLSFDGSAKNVYLLNFAANRVTFIWLYIALTSFTCLRAKGGYKPQTIFTVVTTTSLTVLEVRGGGGEEQVCSPNRKCEGDQHSIRLRSTWRNVKNKTKDKIDKCLDR